MHPDTRKHWKGREHQVRLNYCCASAVTPATDGSRRNWGGHHDGIGKKKVCRIRCSFGDGGGGNPATTPSFSERKLQPSSRRGEERRQQVDERRSCEPIEEGRPGCAHRLIGNRTNPLPKKNGFYCSAQCTLMRATSSMTEKQMARPPPTDTDTLTTPYP